MAVGARLRACREERALSLQAIADRTRIAPAILRAIERDEFKAVPTGIFVRGYLRAFAREVGEDPEAVVSRYLAEFEPPPPEPDAVRTADSGAPVRSSRAFLEDPAQKEYAMIAATILAGVLAVHAWSSFFSHGDTGDPAAATARPAPATEPAAPRPTVATTDAARRWDGDAVTVTHRPGATGPARRPVRVTLVAIREVWVAAEADGNRVLYRLLDPDETVDLTADDRIQLRVGDAGALLVSANGSDAATAGAPGQVRDLAFGPDSSFDE